MTPQVDAAWLARLEKQRSSHKHPFLTGPVFTPADAAVYVALKANSSLIGASTPKVAAYVANISKRPSLA